MEVEMGVLLLIYLVKGLGGKSGFIYFRSCTYSTCGINCVSNERELRFVETDDSCKYLGIQKIDKKPTLLIYRYRPIMNSNLELDWCSINSPPKVFH